MIWLLVIAVVAFLAWRMDYWPFDGSFAFLTKYDGKRDVKTPPAIGPKPVSTTEPTL